MKKFINQLPFKKTITLSLIVLFVFSAPMIMLAVEKSDNVNSGQAKNNNVSGNNIINNNASPKSLLAKGLATQNADGSITVNDPIEQKEKRSKNSKTYLIGFTKEGAAKYKGRFYGSDIHYFNYKTNQYEDIDTALEDYLDKWQMTRANYYAQLTKKLGDNFITFNNQGQELYFSLLGYPNHTVTAKKNNKEKDKWQNKQAIYENALGEGINIEVGLDIEKLVKEVVIENQEALGDLTGKEYYEIPFKLTSNRDIDIRVDGQLLSEVGTITTNQAVEVIDDEGGLSLILAPKAEDGNGGITSIEIRYTLTDDGIIMTKKLPVAWLENAVYPVRTDAVVSYDVYSGDGTCENQGIASWDSAHDATSCNYVRNSDTYMSPAGTKEGTWFLYRAFFPFDISSLPSGVNIENASVNLYAQNVLNEDVDVDSYLVVVETSQVSYTSLVAADFDNVSDTELSATTTIDNLSTSAYNEFTLNSTGRALLTGDTAWFGMRTGWDINDSGASITGHNYGNFRTSEYTGTDYDPYLEVYWNTAPTEPTNLKVEGETNPSKVTDAYPEFYATFNDTGDDSTILYYQLQIATSSNYWDEPLWDTGTSTMATTTEGSRCPSISYGGTEPLAFDGATYYWRIKFWDNDGEEGVWSDIANFTMASTIQMSNVKVEFP